MASTPIVVRIRISVAPLRKVVLGIHLYLGLAAGIFLAILGLTGSIMAFEGDIDHWVHPELWYVTPGPGSLPESELILIAQNHYYPERVLTVQFPRASDLVQVMRMTDARIVYINPYNGIVLGDTQGTSSTDRLLVYIHEIHLWLIPDPASAPQLAQAGRSVLSIAALFLCFLAPTGLILWWRRKRLRIRKDPSSPWFVYFHDVHQILGIYAALLLWIASLTGILIGFDVGGKMFYSITKSVPPAPLKPVPSVPDVGAEPIQTDQVLNIARHAMPDASVAMLLMPIRTTGSFTVLMRVPEETSQNVHSAVTIDQYSGKVLEVRNYLTDSPGYRLIRLNRSIHNGDIFGFPSHIIVSLAGLLLPALAISGFVIWRKKLAA